MNQMRIAYLIAVAICASWLAACTGNGVFAPTSDVTAIESIPKSGVYRVVHGDTLYSIAWRYGLDYRYLAKRNHMKSPYILETGQSIYLIDKVPSYKTSTLKKSVSIPTPTLITALVPQPAPAPAPTLVQAPAPTPTIIKKSKLATVKKKHKHEAEPTASVTTWLWPAQGQVVGGFSSLNKGINISGLAGTPINATAAGKVVYTGKGLRGYGNLIIIKHNATFLTAYAHSSVVLVHQGDWIDAGQKIAEMGNTVFATDDAAF